MFWNSKDFYKATHFCFWYQTETFKHHEKWNSWGQEKCRAPPLNLHSPVWIFSSSPISNLIPKSVECILKMGLGDDTIVVTREWLQCSKLKIWDKCSFVNWIGLSITESRYDGWQFLDLPWWNISKDWFCCRTFGLKVWRGLGKY